MKSTNYHIGTTRKDASSKVFEIYQERKLGVLDNISMDGWDIKLYTITKNESFKSDRVLAEKENICKLFLNLRPENGEDVYQKAILIIHEAREGVILVFSWWTGGEMIQSLVRFVSFQENKLSLEPIFKTDAIKCIWEIEIYTHERKAWITHVLNKANNPDFKAYLQDRL